MLVQMLLEVEQLSQTPINYLFDWVAGTSTGGILALGKLNFFKEKSTLL